MSDFESEAFNAYQTAANPIEEVAVEADVVDEPVEAVTTEDEEAAVETESVDVDAEEEIVAEEDAPEAEALDDEPETEAESADFQDLLDEIPTEESLLAKHKRIPQESKDELVRLANNWRADHEIVQKFGGEEGVKILEPMLGLISKPDAGNEEARAVFQTVIDNNPQAAMALAADSALFFLTDEAASMGYGKIGDAITQSVFGADMQTIRDYVTLEKAGYIDRENDLLLATEGGQGSTLVSSLSDENAELKKLLAQRDEQIKNPTQPKAEQELTATFTENFDTKVQTALTPFFERAGWAKDSPLAKLATNALLNELKTEPEFASALKHVQQTGDKGFAVTQAMTNLVNKAKARIATTTREVNTQLRAKPTKTESAVEKGTATKPKSETLKQAPQNTNTPMPPVDFEAEAYKRAKESGAFAS